MTKLKFFLVIKSIAVNDIINDSSPVVQHSSSTKPIDLNIDSSNAYDMKLESDADAWTWPSENVERVKLLVPNDCNQRTCVFRFDSDRRLLTVALDGDAEENVLDVIDPKDIIGVNVEIKLRDHDNEISQINEQGRSSPTTTKSVADNEPVSEVPFDTRGAAVLSLYVYPKGKPGRKGSILRFCGAERNHPKTQEGMDQCLENRDATNSNNESRYCHHRQFTVAPLEDFTDLSIMVNAIRNLSQSIPSSETRVTKQDEERILVIVNPNSGKKSGVNIYDMTLRPMLEQAGIAYDCLITSHAKHAEERMKKQSSTSDFRDISDYTGIVLVGGDGTIHEVIQGIHQRADRNEILGRLKLGAIGAGTSNGFSASLAYASKVGPYT